VVPPHKALQLARNYTEESMDHNIIISLLPFLPVLFFGLGQGPTSEAKKQFRDLSGVAEFATSQGEGDILSADNFWKSILSGDPNKIARVLGPQTSAINKQAQEEKKTLSEFGTRSGGTAAKAAGINDSVRTNYEQMLSSLTGEAAGALGASGSSLLSAGISAHEGAFSEANVIQQQHAAQLNDIFKSISEIVGAFAMPGAGGAAAGGAVGSEADLMSQIA